MDRSTSELQVLYKISRALARQHSSLKDLLDEVLLILETDMAFSIGTLTLKRQDVDIFVIESSRGLSAEERRRGQYKPGEGITGRVAKSGRPEVVPDISNEPGFLNLTRARKNKKAAFICLPIIHRRQVVGTLSFDRPISPGMDLDRDLDFLRLVAGLIAEAVATTREQIAEHEGLMSENRRLRQQLEGKYQIGNIVGNCSTMRLVYDQIMQVADSNATVLVRGQSGTGKELVARAIHSLSPRKNNPFVGVNCAALPEGLVESELFGHEKGAFSGASQQRKGRFELASGGTLFLDEIGDISPAVQVRLLRVLQEREFQRVGGEKEIKANVRIVAATSRDLEEAIKTGRFRDDLYYRLNVFPIHLPPLRERRSDILLLADYFVQKYNGMYNKKVRRISTEAINMMMMYHWPGNVRELENCIERSVLTSSDDVIHGFSLPPSLQTSDQTRTALLPEKGANLRKMVESYERELIIDALKKHRGNAAASARELRTTQRVLNYKIGHLGINPKDYRWSPVLD
ncbi:MAG: sigma 54-interacting transcriptional regulator [Myxococcota bacterium]|jgi:Nif-specific regulatory protein